MLLKTGQTLVGASGKFNYRLLRPLATGNKAVQSTLFKAEILSAGIAEPPARWWVYPVFLALESM